MKLVLQQVAVRGPVRLPYLAVDAAASLRAIEKDTGGLVYLDMWRDPVGCLLANRIRRSGLSPGYTPHSYGLAVDLDLKAVLDEKKIRYEDLLYVMKKRGWFCHRRDGQIGQPEAEHFNYLGDLAEKYLVKTTMDPTTWGRPAEERIFEKHGKDFRVTLPEAQRCLAKIGLYNGPFSDAYDAYTREAILAFQRTYDLVEDGTAGLTFCRVLSYVSASVELRPVSATS